MHLNVFCPTNKATIHAKDNIPFHTAIFPTLLFATNDNYRLPDKIVSGEHITIEGEKLSKSKGNYITLRHLLNNYPADAIRYYFSINNPETRDFNFTYEVFINSINSELLGKWVNFVNRTLQFINKSFAGKLNSNKVDEVIESKLKELYAIVGNDIDIGDTKVGLSKIFNINNLLKAYSFATTKKVEEYLNSNINSWNYKRLDNIELSKEIEPLLIRYDKSKIEEKRKLLSK